ASKFDSRDDTNKLIEALEGLEMKEGDDFPQGDKTLRKADHQAFLREFLYEVRGGNFHLLETVAKDKTYFPPACNFTAKRARDKWAWSSRRILAPRQTAGEPPPPHF